MAGFAVFMTIVTFGFFALVTTCVLSLILYGLAKRKLQEAETRNNSLVVISVFAPFCGLLWLVVALLLHVQISNRLAHQDCGLSGDPYVTLPNGYIIGSFNTYSGYFKAPGYETDVPVTGPGYVRSIISLKFNNGYFTGTLFDFKTSTVRRFMFDTRTRESKTFPVGPLSWDAANTQAQTGDNSYWVLYAKYRHRWPTYVLWALLLLGEGGIGFWVWKSWNALRNLDKIS